MKTAMTEFIEKLAMKTGDSLYALAFYYDNDEIIKEALGEEKAQICNSYIDGIEGIYMPAEEYYNQTYNQNK